VHIIVATPGRLADLLNSGKLTLDVCRYICLDEGDRMLDLGFDEEVRVTRQYTINNHNIVYVDNDYTVHSVNGYTVYCVRYSWLYCVVSMNILCMLLMAILSMLYAVIIYHDFCCCCVASICTIMLRVESCAAFCI
jgi:DEAD/DEAH box helicase